jgi:hypothetical protein
VQDGADLSPLLLLLQPAAGGASDVDDFQAYADPAGHPFCLCRVTSQ